MLKFTSHSQLFHLLPICRQHRSNGLLKSVLSAAPSLPLILLSWFTPRLQTFTDYSSTGFFSTRCSPSADCSCMGPQYPALKLSCPTVGSSPWDAALAQGYSCGSTPWAVSSSQHPLLNCELFHGCMRRTLWYNSPFDVKGQLASPCTKNDEVSLLQCQEHLLPLLLWPSCLQHCFSCFFSVLFLSVALQHSLLCLKYIFHKAPPLGCGAQQYPAGPWDPAGPCRPCHSPCTMYSLDSLRA